MHKTQSNSLSWRLSVLLPLTLLLACSKAEFTSDGGGGGSGGDSLTGTGGISGTGGTIGSGGVDAGDEDAPIDMQDQGDLVADGGEDADVATDLGGNDTMPPPDADGSTDGEAGGDAATGIAPTQAGDILISEILYDSAGVSDSLAEWFEVYNPSPDVTYDLRNCGITDSSTAHLAMITSSLLIAPGTYHAFARSAGEFVPDLVYDGAVRFDNTGPDRVAILCNAVLIDVFNYTPDGISGHTFSVDPIHLKHGESNVAGNYCHSNIPYGPGGNFGTPGKVNPPCPAGRFP